MSTGEVGESRVSSRLEGLARSALAARLSKMSSGELEIRDAEGVLRLGEPGSLPQASVEVLDPALYRRLLIGGSIGAAESYALGEWRSDDLTAVCRMLARNLDSLDAMEGGLARLARPLWKAVHFLRGNSRGGSARNIAAHYDLGNEFFESFLDTSMTYSSAIYSHPKASLEEAQSFKLDLICRKLELAPGDRLIEIGCGWGSLAIHAAREYGVHVVGTTISREQRRLAQKRVREAGLSDRVEIVLTDYRDLPTTVEGPFDKLVSIEMIEAVGHRYLPTYFEVIDQLVARDGLVLLQAILMSDARYETYRKSVDFIQRYIFPGSLLPSTARVMECMANHTQLRLLDFHDITEHYAETLAEWRGRLSASSSALRGLGLEGSFLRMWEFYFCYCEAGFRERTVADAQLLFAKPRNRSLGLRAISAP